MPLWSPMPACGSVTAKALSSLQARPTATAPRGLRQRRPRTRNLAQALSRVRSGDDLAFTRSDWTRGIEWWRFNLPWDYDYEGDGSKTANRRFTPSCHAIFLRPGETVHMKHYARDVKRFGTGARTSANCRKPLGRQRGKNNQRSTLTLDWNPRGNAMTELRLPGNARRGQYRVEIDGRTTARFTVADFRLPVCKSEVTIPTPNGGRWRQRQCRCAPVVPFRRSGQRRRSHCTLPL